MSCCAATLCVTVARITTWVRIVSSGKGKVRATFDMATESLPAPPTQGLCPRRALTLFRAITLALARAETGLLYSGVACSGARGQARLPVCHVPVGHLHPVMGGRHREWFSEIRASLLIRW